MQEKFYKRQNKISLKLYFIKITYFIDYYYIEHCYFYNNEYQGAVSDIYSSGDWSHLN